MEIRIRILGTVDASVAAAISSVEAAHAKAYARIAATEARARTRSSKESQGAAAQATTSAEKAAREQQRIAERNARTIERIKSASLLKAQRDEEAAARASVKAKEAAEREMTRIADREHKIRQDFYAREEKRATEARQKGRQEMVSRARSFGSSVVSDLSRMGRGVIGGVGEVARGAGLDPSLSGLTGKVISTETAAIRATTSGLGAKGKVASQRDVEDTLGAIHAAGNATSVSFNDMADALERFVTRSADLDMGRSLLKDMGNLANASGVSMQDLAEAAGGLAFNMSGYGDSAEEAQRKSKDLMEMMRILAKQGSMGAVEMKDMATYLPKIASAARDIGGDYKTNVSQLGAIAQESMKGGRATAPEAIRAAQAFVGDLSKDSILKKLLDAGINPYTDDTHTKKRSTSDIMTAIYAKTGGDQAKLGKIFTNVMSLSAVKGFSETFLEAGGGEAGLEAIRKKFKSYEGSFSTEDIANSAKLTQNSKAGKAQALQNQFEESWGRALDKLAPQIDKLIPLAAKAVEAFSKLVVGLAEDPGRAIRLAIIASVAKAGIGEAISSSLKAAIGSFTGGGPGGGGGYNRAAGLGGGMGLAGNLGAGLAIAAAAVTITAAGVEIIDSAFKSNEKAAAKGVSDENQAAADRANARITKDQKERAEAIAHLERRNAQIDSNIEAGRVLKETPTGALSASFEWMGGLFTGGGRSWGTLMAQKAAYENRSDLYDEKTANEQAIRAAKDNTIREKKLLFPGVETASGGTIGFSANSQLGRNGFAEKPKTPDEVVAAKVDGVKSAVDAASAAIVAAIGNIPGAPSAPAPRTGPAPLYPGMPQ